MRKLYVAFSVLFLLLSIAAQQNVVQTYTTAIATTATVYPPSLLTTVTAAPFDCTPLPGKHCVALSWTASITPGVTYTIYRINAPTGACGSTKIITGLTGTTYVDTAGLADGQPYDWAVTAVLGGTESVCSNDFPGSTSTPPSSPSALGGIVH